MIHKPRYVQKRSRRVLESRMKTQARPRRSPTTPPEKHPRGYSFRMAGLSQHWASYFIFTVRGLLPHLQQKFLLLLDIKHLSFQAHINAITNCATIQNLCQPSVMQDSTNKHIYGCIVLFRNFSLPYFIGSIMYSWKFILSCLLTK